MILCMNYMQILVLKSIMMSNMVHKIWIEMLTHLVQRTTAISFF